jgi:hypothetical protein
MGRGNVSSNKRRREAEREQKKRDKQERARQRRAEGGTGIATASVSDIQTAAVNSTVEEIQADGTVVTSESLEHAAASGMPCRLFVGGLSWDTTAGDLRKVFAEIGEVVDAVIVTDRDTGDSRGFGFVTMADRKSATKAMRELGGYELDGRSLRIDMASER